MTMVIVYLYILQQNLWINIYFDEDTVGNIIHGTIWDLDTRLVFYDISNVRIWVLRVNDPVRYSSTSSRHGHATVLL